MLMSSILFTIRRLWNRRIPFETAVHDDTDASVYCFQNKIFIKIFNTLGLLFLSNFFNPSRQIIFFLVWPKTFQQQILCGWGLNPSWKDTIRAFLSPTTNREIFICDWTMKYLLVVGIANGRKIFDNGIPIINCCFNFFISNLFSFFK